MEQRPAIFKLNLDCFDHVFDYLVLEDLDQFSQTCKAMKWAVGEYYQTNYGAIEAYAELVEENVHLPYYTVGYCDFVQRLYIHPHKRMDNVVVKWDLSRKVMELTIKIDRWKESQLRHIEYIINNAEVLNIIFEFGMSYETVPGMCNSLKRLSMRDFQCANADQIQDGNKWLLREYPTLEHLEWTQHRKHGFKINEIKAFFERNPNVRSFATDAYSLWESRHLIIESGVKLDDLTIECNQLMYEDDPQMFENICILSNELYEKGVYKWLHLTFPDIYEQLDAQLIHEVIDQIIPINAVRSMSLPRISNVDLSKLVNLVELHIPDYVSEAIRNFDMMAKHLANLERVQFEYAYLEEMLSFIYHSVKLKKLKVTQFCGYEDGDYTDLDLANMNERREQLLNASKVTIFIEEEFYLATKWASTLTDYRLIEMRRNTAHHFEWR